MAPEGPWAEILVGRLTGWFADEMKGLRFRTQLESGGGAAFARRH